MHSSLHSFPFFFLLLSVSLPKASSFMGISAGVGIWINGRGGRAGFAAPVPNAEGDEYRALQAWKAAIFDDPNGILSSWVGADVCSYERVYCSDPPEPISSASSVVAVVDLNGANLQGTLVDELSLLAHLSVLHLNSNRFSGPVPDPFRDLHYLSELDLSNNLFSGPFPTSTLLIPNLVYLDLRFNSFSGRIPDELFEKELDAIFLNDNKFEGEIPMGIWASAASAITLANNQLTGSIPANFGYMGSGVKEILFLNNKLTGCIPEGLGYLTGMQVLDLSFNSLTGRLPESLSCLAGIQILNVGHNKLTGELPELVCELRSLVNLTVAYNFFSGVSDDCTRLGFRNVGFNLSGNCIPGMGMQRPAPECEGGAPAGSLNCLKIPGTRPMACTAAGGMTATLPGFFRASVP
ncbi:Leucine-rich repeat extensin-like protein 4 [Apostasia shenzhenica]|uniref:Cell wall hydroxyproline-rich glycoprotein n=1 Tax=Apostasia shenzhenica TaxID=1088818 RepID=A0A2I0ATZ6_9ASPA|nr:Leucine-rich repeat extensin-like protein 4 [Apostasia shenzhenica]